MSKFTTNTFTMKREIVSFSNKLTSLSSRTNQKFSADMIYGILASQSCLLTDIADKLHEPIQKINTVERLSRNLHNPVPDTVTNNYLNMIRKWIPDEAVIHLDDSDIVKPCGYKFEHLCRVRDGSESSSTKNIYKNGYHVTEACVLTKNNHPVSVFSKIYSSKEDDFISANTITFEAMEHASSLFDNATFVMDRGYDDNKTFLKMYELNKDFVIRLTAKRKLLYHNKWTPATELRNRRKGKVKMSLVYRGRKQEAYLSHVKVKVTASRKDVYLVLVYGLTEHPMMLATNKEIRSKDDLIKIAKLYFSRWRIEEYFRCKKQVFQFENFRVRKLKAINALNFYITVCMAFLANMSMKLETNALKTLILRVANPIREKVQFLFYRLSKGISSILSYAKEGVRLWFKTKRPKYQQIRFKLVS